MLLLVQLGDEDGHGFYGILDEDPSGLLCHECGERFVHLGLHAWKGHGVTAVAYRRAHGLASRGLVAESTRAKQADNSRRTLDDKAAFLAKRDPARAWKASGPMSPAGREAVRAALAGRKGTARRGLVVTCRWCGSQFCPLAGAKRRKFCSRSCASKATRAAERSRPRLDYH